MGSLMNPARLHKSTQPLFPFHTSLWNLSKNRPIPFLTVPTNSIETIALPAVLSDPLIAFKPSTPLYS